MPILLWEAVAEPSTRFPRCHCSVVAELANRDLLVGYYAGEDEARPDVAWVLARRRPDAKAFDPLTVVAETPGKPEGNGILFQNREGTVLVIYGTMQGKLDGPAGPGVRWETCDLRIKRSKDNGHTWSASEFIEPKLGHVPRNKPIRLSNGEIIFGTEYMDGYSRFWISADEGRTWHMTGPVKGELNEQPTLIQRRDGTILAFLRPDGDAPCIYRSVSKDNGRTWSPAKQTGLPCPFAAIALDRLADGRMVLAWNNNPSHRNPLTLAISEDEGETWPHVRNMVIGDGEFHYPAIIQTHDGLLHLSFTNNRRTIDHIVLTPDWIEGKGRDLPPWTSAEGVRRV
jgi:hypothetical protein